MVEVAGLSERPGTAQVDEPALREGLPLKRARWESYLSWAVRAFRLSTVVADPATQIVTHLCYSEFADILPVGVLLHPIQGVKVQGLRLQRLPSQCKCQVI